MDKAGYSTARQVMRNYVPTYSLKKEMKIPC
jgi:hypothetical protein